MQREGERAGQREREREKARESSTYFPEGAGITKGSLSRDRRGNVSRRLIILRRVRQSDF